MREDAALTKFRVRSAYQLIPAFDSQRVHLLPHLAGDLAPARPVQPEFLYRDPVRPAQHEGPLPDDEDVLLPVELQLAVVRDDGLPPVRGGVGRLEQVGPRRERFDDVFFLAAVEQLPGVSGLPERELRGSRVREDLNELRPFFRKIGEVPLLLLYPSMQVTANG